MTDKRPANPKPAWEGIERVDELPEGPGTTWVNILVRDGKFMEVLEDQR